MAGPGRIRFLGIDYSGAGTPEEGLAGLEVFLASGDGPAERVAPAAGARRRWSRRALAGWLEAELSRDGPAWVGIDHGFSFPEEYFERHALPRSWDAFLGDFCGHWPTADAGVRVREVRQGRVGEGLRRLGDPRWRRQTERRVPGTKSVFHFGVNGEVATSTHAGLPWLARIRAALRTRLHVWPFDGWRPPAGAVVVAEVFPSLSRGAFSLPGASPHARDAHAVCRWLQAEWAAGRMGDHLSPGLTLAEERVARHEGWILGVG